MRYLAEGLAESTYNETIGRADSGHAVNGLTSTDSK